MAINQPARDGAAESMSEFARRRNQQQAQHRVAQAAGHQAYGEAIRTGHDLTLSNPADVTAHGIAAQTNGAAQTDDRIGQPNFAEVMPIKVGHPGFAESVIPIWDSGREAIADLQDHDYPGTVLNGVLAALDAFLAGSAAQVLAKGGTKASLYAVRGAISKDAAKADWDNVVRQQMRDLGLRNPTREGHHWLIPQRWRDVPAQIRNHPLNIHGMEREVHRRVHTRFLGKPKFGPLEQYWHGTPHWSKVTSASAVGHPLASAEAERRR